MKLLKIALIYLFINVNLEGVNYSSYCTGLNDNEVICL